MLSASIDYRQYSENLLSESKKLISNDEPISTKLAAYALIDSYKNLLNYILIKMNYSEPHKYDLKQKMFRIYTHIEKKKERDILEEIEVLRNKISHNEIHILKKEMIINLIENYPMVFSNLDSSCDNYLKRMDSIESFQDLFFLGLDRKFEYLDTLLEEIRGFGSLIGKDTIENFQSNYNKAREKFDRLRTQDFKPDHYVLFEFINDLILEFEEARGAGYAIAEDYKAEQLSNR